MKIEEVIDYEIKCNLCGNILKLNTHDNEFGKCNCGNSQVQAGTYGISWYVPKELKDKGELYSEHIRSKPYYLNVPNLSNEESKMLNYILNSKSTKSRYSDSSDINISYGNTKNSSFVKYINYRSCILNFKGYNYTGMELMVTFTEEYNKKLLCFYRLCRMADKNNMKFNDYIESIARKDVRLLPNYYTETVEVLDFRICL